MNTVYSLDFLPQSQDTLMVDPSTAIRNLKLIRNIFIQGIDALNCFLNDEYYKFDAQVGETLCQIRAYKIYLLAIDKSPNKRNKIEKNLENLKEKCLIVCEKITELQQWNKKERYDKNTTLIDLFKKNKLYFDIHIDIFFIISCYILSKYSSKNNDGIPVGINQEKVEADFNISKHLAKRMTNNLQKKISMHSCNFIFEILHDLKMINVNRNRVLPLLQRTADEGRVALPCFEVTNIILQHLIENNGGFFFLVKNSSNDDIALFFIAKNKSIKSVAPIPENIKNNPYIFFKGTTSAPDIISKNSLVNKFILTNADKVILANSAAHPQYSGKNLHHLRINPFEDILKHTNDEKILLDVRKLNDELTYFKNFSDQHGCKERNDDLFFIKHIFCDMASNQVRRSKNSLFKTKESLGVLVN